MAYVYYNENDPKCVAWLNKLIKRGVIADGCVDSRSIEDVPPSDLEGFSQCHFFAGIGGWSYALRLAGWPDDRSVWTGSCPCQPFSTSGKKKGFADERHLWPAWHWLIRQCRPGVIFGEQVAAALSWIDLVSGDMEDETYAFGYAVLGAHSVGAPHIRQRLYWVANNNKGPQGWGRPELSKCANERIARPSDTFGELADNANQRYERAGSTRHGWAGSENNCATSGLAHNDGRQPSDRKVQRGRRFLQLTEDSLAGFWAGSDWIACTDGKYRPVESGTFPLAHGAPARVGRLRGYGNAIVPQVAAAFIKAYQDCRSEVLNA